MSLSADVGATAATLPHVPPERPTAGAAVEKLRALAHSELPEEALETALRVVLGVGGAGAGALCLFDARQETLRLAAEHGLSDAGCRMVRSIKRGDGESWDMPLRSLLNNRAYLVENTRRGKHVPFLVDGPPHTTVVACIPLYADGFPLGSLLLLSIQPSTLKHADVQALAAPLRELASLVQALRRRAEGERGRGTPPPAERAEPEVGKLREALAAAEATVSVKDAEKRRLEDELAAARAQTEESRRRADQLLAVVETLRRQYSATQTAGPTRTTPEAEPVAEVLRNAARTEEVGRAAAKERVTATPAAVAPTAAVPGATPQSDGASATDTPATTSSPEPASTAPVEPAASVAPTATEAAPPAAATSSAEPQPGVGPTTLPAASPGAASSSSTSASEATVAPASPAQATPSAEPPPPPVAASATSAPVADGAPAAATLPPTSGVDEPSREIEAVVLDQAGIWNEAAFESGYVLALPPDAASEDLRCRNARRIIVNLASPGSVEALARLALTGVHEAWACIAVPERDELIHVGRLKPVCYPVDPEAVASSFERNELTTTRVLAIASNVDTVLALRKALSDRGASVSIAWSAKQALDLIPMLRPQIAIVELAVALREGADAVVLLSRFERPPTFVFLPGEADASRAFAVQLGLPANADILAPRRRWLARILRGDGHA